MRPAAAVAVLCGMVCLCGALRAESPGTDAARANATNVIHDSQVVQVTYSTGERGSRLKWMPHKPQKSAGRPIDSESFAADAQIDSAGVQRAEFNDSSQTVTNAAADPLNDPFGDANQSQSSDRRVASLAGPNAGGPRLRPIAASKNIMPMPGLPSSENDGQLLRERPKLLLSAPDDDDSDTDERRIPSVEEELASNPKHFMDACPSKSSFKSIRELSDDITAKKGKFPRECKLFAEDYQPRTWTPTTFAWTAPGTCNKPLYFEQIQVERYGHSWGPLVQPILSAGHFFVTVPILPYKMGAFPPGECMYSLGYYRPGSCAPYMLDPFPLSVRGGLIQAGTIVGAAYIIP